MVDPIKQFGVESNDPEQLELPLTPAEPIGEEVESVEDDALEDEYEDDDFDDEDDDTSFDEDETPKDDDE